MDEHANAGDRTKTIPKQILKKKKKNAKITLNRERFPWQHQKPLTTRMQIEFRKEKFQFWQNNIRETHQSPKNNN